MPKKTPREAEEKIRHILNFDGTGQRGDQEHPTNPKIIHDSIKPFDSNGVRQESVHFDGVGTRGKWKLTRLFNQMTGKDLEDIVLDAYEHLVENYQPGDELVMTGYSRGAFIARTLNGMMYNVGIIDKDKFDNKEDLRKAIRKAFEVYKDEEVLPNSDEAVAFREKYSQESRPITNHMTLFDTVEALGPPFQFPIAHAISKGRFKFHDDKVNPNTLSVSQALALDERRDNFAKIIVNKVDGAITRINELYFPGDHSAVGGGDPDVKKLSDVAGLWGLNEMREQGGVEFDNKIDERFTPDPTAHSNDSFEPEGFFKYIADNDVREIADDAKLHISVALRMLEDETYRPAQLNGSMTGKIIAWAKEYVDPVVTIVNESKPLPTPAMT